MSVSIAYILPPNIYDKKKNPRVELHEEFLKFAALNQKSYRAFSLTLPASMQIYGNKRKRLHKERVQLPEDWFGTPTCMAAVLLFWNTNMAAVTSYENAPYMYILQQSNIF